VAELAASRPGPSADRERVWPAESIDERCERRLQVVDYGCRQSSSSGLYLGTQEYF